MLNKLTKTLLEALVRHKQIITVVVAAVAIASYMIPIDSIMASVSGNHGSAVSSVATSGGGTGHGATVSSVARGYGNVQINDASNTADVHIHSGNVHVQQNIAQRNSISSSGTGSANTGGTATHTATVHTSSQGHHIKGGGLINLHQSISHSLNQILSKLP
ncbi:MAG: hypothetical protein M3P08_06825 [Thermoproteota archaeon]|nr:hypothetical protein [Thermoproteota archaeon]